MKFKNLSIVSFLLVSFFLISIYTVYHQNNTWASNNGRVGFSYWFVVPFIWFKVSAFLLYGIYYQLRIINNKITDFYFAQLKLMGIRKRLFSQLIDGVSYVIIWPIILVLGALILMPFYKNGLITITYKQRSAFTMCFNYMTGIGGYVFLGIILIYSVIMEYFQQSTFGKMMLNCGIISVKKKKPTFFAVLLKNVIRFVPLNDFFYYFRRITLSDYLSGIRTIELEEDTTGLYNNYLQNDEN